MTQKILIYILLVILETIAVALFFPVDFVFKEVAEEQVSVHDVLGRDLAEDVQRRSDSLFTKAFGDTGIVEASYNMMVPTDSQKQASRGMDKLGNDLWGWVASRLGAFWAQMYQAIYRFTLVLTWLPYTLPIVVPATVDGLVTREIKKRTAGYASPVRYHAATHTIILLIFAVPFYAMYPFSVSPWFAPTWTAALAITLAILTSNIQKRL